MARPLEGKTAFVTGAGSGIGRAIATRLHREGARVAVTGRDEDALAAVVAALGEGARAYRCDVTLPASVDEAVDHAAREQGGLHILVHNAGLSGQTPVTSEDDAGWRAILDTNLTGAWYCARAAVRHLSDDGRILYMSSVLGKVGVAGASAYCAAKHGVIGLARALAAELAPRGIQVNAVCPGWVDTEMARASMRAQAARDGISEDEFRARALAAVPQRRMLAPEEVAGLVFYLCLPESRGVTGQAFSIDGGQTGIA